MEEGDLLPSSCVLRRDVANTRFPTSTKGMALRTCPVLTSSKVLHASCAVLSKGVLVPGSRTATACELEAHKTGPGEPGTTPLLSYAIAMHSPVLTWSHPLRPYDIAIHSPVLT